MEAVIFVGLQASGKSTFYVERFFQSHVRISLDLLRTRHREQSFMQTCLDTRQPFVVDNTNPTIAERARYLAAARAANYRVLGYYFIPDVAGSLRRNKLRSSRFQVPPAGIYGTRKRLQPPSYDEGFDLLFTVALDGEDGFQVAEVPRAPAPSA